MKPTQMTTPFTQLYERKTTATVEGNGLIYRLGRRVVYYFNIPLWMNLSCHESHFDDGRSERYASYYHRTDGEPAYSSYLKRTWDVGGLMFCNIERGKTQSRIVDQKEGEVFADSLEETDYPKAVALWNQMFGENWLDAVAKDPSWRDRWKAAVREHNLKYEV